jgi:hypothetical protein
MGKSQELAALKCKNLKDAGMYGDGAGLSLKVTERGTKSWVFRFMFAGKAANLGLGAYPDVTLAEAREHAAEHRATIRSGINPTEVKKAKIAAIKAEQGKARV